MVLKITPEVVSCAVGQPIENNGPAFFDPETYELYRSDEEIPPTIPKSILIEFPKIRQVDVQRAYVESLNDRSILGQFRNLTDEQFWKTFWVIFDDDGIRSARFREFERAYCLQTVIAWCNDNGIACYVAQS